MTDRDSCGGSPLDASKDRTEGESQLDSLLDEIDEINGANDRDGATDQDVVQIERKNNASRAKKIAREQAVRLQLQQEQVAVAENEARELAGRAGGGTRGESDCGADAAAVEAGHAGAADFILFGKKIDTIFLQFFL
jgi:hypothetical protein